MIKKILLYGFIAIVAIFLLIQLVPYGRNHTNPPVVKEPAWDSPQTQALFQQACADCHSNNTTWYWYSNIAPFSWLIQRDVDEGRARLNYSECGVPRPRREGGFEGRSNFPNVTPPPGGFQPRFEGGGDVSEVILRGSMPPIQYTLIHPSANLSTAERQALAQGLANSPCQ